MLKDRLNKILKEVKDILVRSYYEGSNGIYLTEIMEALDLRKMEAISFYEMFRDNTMARPSKRELRDNGILYENQEFSLSPEGLREVFSELFNEITRLKEEVKKLDNTLKTPIEDI